LVSESVSDQDDALLAQALQEAEDEDVAKRRAKKEKRRKENEKNMKEKEEDIDIYLNALDTYEDDNRLAQLIQDEEYAKSLQSDINSTNDSSHLKKRAPISSESRKLITPRSEVKTHTPRERIRKPASTTAHKEREHKLRLHREKVLSEENQELQSDILEWRTNFSEKFHRVPTKDDVTPEIRNKLLELSKVKRELKDIYSKKGRALSTVNK